MHEMCVAAPDAPVTTGAGEPRTDRRYGGSGPEVMAGSAFTIVLVFSRGEGPDACARKRTHTGRSEGPDSSRCGPQPRAQPHVLSSSRTVSLSIFLLLLVLDRETRDRTR